MISHFRKLIALPLALLLTLSLPSCDSLSYREAVVLYNAQEYAQAAELFSQLGDYEDSATLFKRSRYWEAVKLMEEGKYSTALPRFIKLGDYEDCPQRLTECRYQLAVEAFENDEYQQAEKDFLEFADYRQTPEYLRQINWQKFYDYVCDAGSEDGSLRVITIPQEDRTVSASIDSEKPGRLTFAVVWEKDMGYVFRDDLTVTLTRDSLEATFSASSTFAMDFKGKEIGSLQTTDGHFSITDCTADTELTADSFQMTVTDNLGKNSSSSDPADSTMQDAIQENFAAIIEVLPQILADSGLGISPVDIGFEKLA